jgi:hypothetical protein
LKKVKFNSDSYAGKIALKWCNLPLTFSNFHTHLPNGQHISFGIRLRGRFRRGDPAANDQVFMSYNFTFDEYIRGYMNIGSNIDPEPSDVLNSASKGFERRIPQSPDLNLLNAMLDKAVLKMYLRIAHDGGAFAGPAPAQQAPLLTNSRTAFWEMRVHNLNTSTFLVADDVNFYETRFQVKMQDFLPLLGEDQTTTDSARAMFIENYYCLCGLEAFIFFYDTTSFLPVFFHNDAVFLTNLKNHYASLSPQTKRHIQFIATNNFGFNLNDVVIPSEVIDKCRFDSKGDELFCFPFGYCEKTHAANGADVAPYAASEYSSESGQIATTYFVRNAGAGTDDPTFTVPVGYWGVGNADMNLTLGDPNYGKPSTPQGIKQGLYRMNKFICPSGIKIVEKWPAYILFNCSLMSNALVQPTNMVFPNSRFEGSSGENVNDQRSHTVLCSIPIDWQQNNNEFFLYQPTELIYSLFDRVRFNEIEFWFSFPDGTPIHFNEHQPVVCLQIKD